MKKHCRTNPVAVAMVKRYGYTTTQHGDRRDRRSRDARHDPIDENIRECSQPDEG